MSEQFRFLDNLYIVLLLLQLAIRRILRNDSYKNMDQNLQYDSHCMTAESVGRRNLGPFMTGWCEQIFR